MRKIMTAVMALAVAVGVPTAVLAASGGTGPSALDLQASEWTNTAATTSSATFQPIPALSGPTSVPSTR